MEPKRIMDRRRAFMMHLVNSYVRGCLAIVGIIVVGPLTTEQRALNCRALKEKRGSDRELPLTPIFSDD